MQTNQQHISYSFEDIEKYFQGKMTAAEMHELEKAALQDAFLADAVEGYKNSSLQQSQQDLKDIRNKILNKKEKTKVVPLIPSKKWVWIAASVVGIILTGSLFWLNNKSIQSSNLVVTKSATAPKSKANSIGTNPQQKIADSSTKIAASISKENRVAQQKDTAITNYHHPAVSNNNEEAYIAQKAPSLDSLALSLNETVTNAKSKLPTVQPAGLTQINPALPATLSSALTGKVAGVTAIDGENNQSIRIRGNKSTSKSKDPLVVINGIPSSQNFSNINTNDITSVKILKDTTALGIYGSRAANGVILVTTKSNNNITGRIVDDKGNPVPNASVMHGNEKSTQTNNQGYFNITSNDSVLKSTVAAIGFSSANQTLYKNKINNIILHQNAVELNDVVVIGYSSTKKYSGYVGAAASVISKTEAEPSMPKNGWDNFKPYLINELEKENALKGINIHGTYHFKYRLDKNDHIKSIKIISSPDKRINPYFIKALQNRVQWHVTSKSSQKHKATVQL